jgi:hypothetical protein
LLWWEIFTEIQDLPLYARAKSRSDRRLDRGGNDERTKLHFKFFG